MLILKYWLLIESLKATWSWTKLVCRLHVVGGTHIYLCSSRSLALRIRPYSFDCRPSSLHFSTQLSPWESQYFSLCCEDPVISTEFHSAHSYHAFPTYNILCLDAGKNALSPMPQGIHWLWPVLHMTWSSSVEPGYTALDSSPCKYFHLNCR